MDKTNLVRRLAEVFELEETGYGLALVLKLLDEELALRMGFEEAKKTVQAKLKLLNLKRIQFGGGTRVLEGWTNVDITEPADLVWDVREELPFPDLCAEHIFSEHMLEHLPYPRAKLWVRECARILKPGGRLIVGVPDAGQAMKAYAQGDDNYLRELKQRWYAKRTNLEDYDAAIDIVDLVVYDQEADIKYHRHYWGYDEAKLSKILLQSGFVKVGKWAFDPDLANPKREWGSVYVEAVK